MCLFAEAMGQWLFKVKYISVTGRSTAAIAYFGKPFNLSNAQKLFQHFISIQY